MFGAMLGSQWGIVRTTKKSTYYLSNEHNDDLTKIAWTKRKDKARRFETKNDAVRTLETIQQARKNKISNITTALI